MVAPEVVGNPPTQLILLGQAVLENLENLETLRAVQEADGVRWICCHALRPSNKLTLNIC